ncbi:hypothetical protein LTSEWAN_0427 [Salmonella enterica subsp. enterica serovar Wandsworth str. A4-580]|uniref:Smf/DprA SAM domain-containing protein n=1 Tax=Salmonella enterica subsp. enterica serovar Wandsworth str. A4-580 TaxID=913086 RepID=G5S6N2_SALET|nr:hypothetical protein LTSEWAN_0427 [Salmonella enterica subsp. enterica serovar Wandsworth str. A4-580]
MARTEIWLRLMYVGDLYGEAMLNMANSLIVRYNLYRLSEFAYSPASDKSHAPSGSWSYRAAS